MSFPQPTRPFTQGRGFILSREVFVVFDKNSTLARERLTHTPEPFRWWQIGYISSAHKKSNLSTNRIGMVQSIQPVCLRGTELEDAEESLRNSEGLG